MPARPRGWRAVVLTVALIAAAGLVAFLVSQRVTALNGSPAPLRPPGAAEPSPTPQPITDLARAALSKVVTVEALRASDEELGTGWLIDDKGDFVTNAHVVDGVLSVRLRDRHDHSHVGKVIGMDPATDIAVIRSTDGFEGSGLVVDEDPVDSPPFQVITIGAGRATGEQELTLETLVQVGQDVPIDRTDVQPGSGTPATYHDMLELDGARIFQGNSGGPVLDGDGKVIGIVTLASKSEPQAFAIPVARVLQELLSFAARPG